jgi:hypothetical protein
MTGSCSNPKVRRSVCLAFVFVCCRPASADENTPADAELRALIDNIAAEEARYQNFELVVSYDYEFLRSREGASPSLVWENQGHWRIVQQDKLRYVSEFESGRRIDGTPIEHRLISAYDGLHTRVLRDGLLNVHDGFREQRRHRRPHMLPLSGTHPGELSLEEYLTRTEARRDVRYQTRIVGAETVDGLNCVKVKVEAWKEGQAERDYRFIWLATERNYFPLKSIAFGVGFSSTVPLEEDSVLEWKEIEPGIWMPMRSEVIVNYTIPAGRGERVPSNRREYRVEKIDLNPKYRLEFFGDVHDPEPVSGDD